MGTRQRILIAKHSSAGSSAILKNLDSQRVDVVAYCDVPPLIKHDHDDVGIDICLLDLRMLQRVARKHPTDITRIQQSGVTVLILPSKHLPKARQFSKSVDGLVVADHLLNFINDSILLARYHHSLVPFGIMALFTVGDAPTALLAKLSVVERTVLGHLGNAHTNQRIATLMQIPEATAKGLVRIVLAKLNLLNRTEAAIFAVRLNRSGQGWPIDGDTSEADLAMEADLTIEAMPMQAHDPGNTATSPG
jgi:DNA-binding NarL/FixJ family response regulator